LIGASETARIVTEFGESFTRRRARVSVAVSEQAQRAKDVLKDALGEERTNVLKRLLGRHPTPITNRAEVRLVDEVVEPSPGPTPLLVTGDLDGPILRGPIPVEHILPGSSDGYRQRRLEMIHDYYDVIG
jgi:hypothetical protein